MAPSPELVVNAVAELMANSSAGKSALADWLGSIVGTKISQGGSPLAQISAKDFAESIQQASQATLRSHNVLGEIGRSELPPLGNIDGEPKVVTGNVREFFVKQMGTLLIPQVRTLEVESESAFAKIFSQNNSILQLTHSEGAGSAFLVDDGLAITADHVIADQAENRLFSGLTAQLADGTTYPAQLIARAPQEDIALLRLPQLGNQTPRLNLIDFRQADFTNPVYLLGHPGGRPLSYLSTGRVMGAEIGPKPPENPAYFQSSVAWVRTSIPAWHGSSGGPLLTESGDVFGMAIKSDYLNSWGTMSNHISFLIDRMRGKVAEKGWIEFAGNASLQSDNTLLIEEASSRLRGN